MPKKQPVKAYSQWTSILFRKSDRIGECDSCHKSTDIGTLIFYFPTIRDPYTNRGYVYCKDCVLSRVEMISIVKEL
jgi:hypothetical protein